MPLGPHSTDALLSTRYLAGSNVSSLCVSGIQTSLLHTDSNLELNAVVVHTARPSRELVHILYSSLLSSLRQSILTSFEEEA